MQCIFILLIYSKSLRSTSTVIGIYKTSPITPTSQVTPWHLGGSGGGGGGGGGAPQGDA